MNPKWKKQTAKSKSKKRGVKRNAWPKKNMVVQVQPAKKRAASTRRTQHVHSQYSESTLSVYRRKTNQVKAMTAVSAPSFYVNNTAQTITVPGGQQAAEVADLLNNIDITYLYGQMPPSGTIAAGYGARRLVIDSIMVESTLTNVASAPVEMELFDISLKKDLPNTWTYEVGSSAYDFTPAPNDYWYQGLCVAQGITPGTYSAGFTPGSSPMDSQFFKDYFKIDKRTLVLLPQGGTHRHFLKFNPNTMVKEDETSTGAAGSTEPNHGLKRLNRWLMVNVKGLPVINSSATPVQATLSSAGVSWVTTYRTKFQFVLDATSSWNGQNLLTSPVASSQKAINIGSGQFDVVTGQVI